MIINFTKALRNSFTTKVFSKFLALKCPQNELEFEPNNYLINNLQFLVKLYFFVFLNSCLMVLNFVYFFKIEVQEYKVYFISENFN